MIIGVILLLLGCASEIFSMDVGCCSLICQLAGVVSAVSGLGFILMDKKLAAAEE